MESGSLLGTRGSDAGYDGREALDRTHDLVQRRAGAINELHAVADLLRTVGDQILDVVGGLRRALRKAANLGRNDCETAAGFTGTRRLHRRIEGEQVGLAGDLVDDGDDIVDLARGVLDPRHRFDGLGYDRTAAARNLSGVVGKTAGLLRAIRIFPHGRGDLLHRRGRLLEIRRLLLGAL